MPDHSAPPTQDDLYELAVDETGAALQGAGAQYDQYHFHPGHRAGGRGGPGWRPGAASAHRPPAPRVLGRRPRAAPSSLSLSSSTTRWSSLGHPEVLYDAYGRAIR